MTELSVVATKIIGMTPNPWRRLAADYPDVEVRYANLGFRWAETHWTPDGAYIVLHRDLNQVQRRAGIAHEVEHLDRGAPCRTLRATIERRVIDATARYLLPDLEVIGDALMAYDQRRAADELWVPHRILVDRLTGMSDADLDYLAGRREACA